MAKVKKEEINEEIPMEETRQESQLVNCLRNEKIIVRYISKPSTLVKDPKHVLYGGMAETSTKTFVVPMLTSGVFKNVLTDEEKDFLEYIMGLEYNALSVYKKYDNFWSSASTEGIAEVELTKGDNYLDLSNPIDYIKYKILLANKDFICPSMEEYNERPKASYQYVIISHNTESKDLSNRVNYKKEAYKELGKLGNDFDTLKTVMELIEKRPISPTVKIEFLEAKADDVITKDAKKFLTVVKDPLLSKKVLLNKCVEAGVVGKRGEGYYLREDNTPLCDFGQEPTISVAAAYLNAPKHQELLFSLQDKVK